VIGRFVSPRILHQRSSTLNCWSATAGFALRSFDRFQAQRSHCLSRVGESFVTDYALGDFAILWK
jgi:hypothetical protein